MLDTIDRYKIESRANGREVRADARAIAELLFLHSKEKAPKRPQRMEYLFALYRDNTERDIPGWRALRQAVIEVEGTRFHTLCDIAVED